MIKLLKKCTLIPLAFSFEATAFDVTTIANVEYIDEWDLSYTKVQIDQPTSCGGTWFWISRDREDYNIYMSRILAALMSGRAIRITERAPAHCADQHLYNPRIGNM